MSERISARDAAAALEAAGYERLAIARFLADHRVEITASDLFPREPAPAERPSRGRPTGTATTSLRVTSWTA